MSKRYLTKELTKILLISTILIFLAGQVILFFFNLSDASRGVEQRVRSILETTNSVLAEAIWDFDNDQINGIGDAMMGHREIIRVNIIDTLKIDAVYESDRSEISNLIYESITMEIVRDNTIIGYIKADYTMDFFYDEMRRKIITEGLILVAIAVVIVFVVNFYAKKVLDPIGDIVMHAENIKGNLYDTLKVDSDSKEIETLVDAINYMKTSILKYTIELEEINNTLELRVEERTHELKEKNDALNHTISLLKEAEKELMRASKLEVTQQLVTGIAHEINTPLGNAITLVSYLPKNLELLKNNIDFPIGNTTEMGIIEDALSHIEESLNQVVEMVSKFRSLDFRSTGSMKKNVRLKEVVNNTLVLITDEIKCNLVVDFVIEDDLMILTKPFVFMEVLKQLIENICIHAYDQSEEKKLRISCDVYDKSVIVYFEDFGKGISEEVLNNIFVPFYKDITTSEGSGIGLSIVENLVVNGLNGRITCKSDIGIGTTFEIEVPRI